MLIDPTNVREDQKIFSGSWKNVPVVGIMPELEDTDERQILCLNIGDDLEFVLFGKKEEQYVAAAVMHLAGLKWRDPIAAFRAFALLEEANEINKESIPLLLSVGYGTWEDRMEESELEELVSAYMSVERFRAIMLSVPGNIEEVLEKLRTAGVEYSLDGMIDEVEANRLAVTDVLRSFGVDRKDVVAERHGRLTQAARKYEAAFKQLIPNVKAEGLTQLTAFVVDLLLKGMEDGAELVAGAWMRLQCRRQDGITVLRSPGATIIMPQSRNDNPDAIVDSVALRVSRIFDGVNPHELVTKLKTIRDTVHLMPIVAK